jgi:hypothetical protein
MTTLLELKEKIVVFYGKNEVFITPVLKFLMAIVLFLLINSNIGYMKSISTLPVALILSLLCAVIPPGGTIAIAALVVLADMYSLSVEVCLVTLVLFVVIFLVYFRFAPRHGYEILLAPVCFGLNIPCIVPVGMGLLREISAVFTMSCGTVLYFFIKGVKDNAGTLSGTAEETEATTSKIVVALNQLLGNKEMYMVLVIMILTMVIVYMVRRMSIEHAWTIAIVTGTLFETVGLVAGYLLMDIRGWALALILGNIVSVGIAFVLEFLFFNLDYSRTERLQFEDDEYYYYVKAVPKAVIAGSQKKVKRFSGGDSDERLTRKKFAEEMEIDENLLN